MRLKRSNPAVQKRTRYLGAVGVIHASVPRMTEAALTNGKANPSGAKTILAKTL